MSEYSRCPTCRAFPNTKRGFCLDDWHEGKNRTSQTVQAESENGELDKESPIDKFWREQYPHELMPPLTAKEVARVKHFATASTVQRETVEACVLVALEQRCVHDTPYDIGVMAVVKAIRAQFKDIL